MRTHVAIAGHLCPLHDPSAESESGTKRKARSEYLHSLVIGHHILLSTCPAGETHSWG